MPGISHDSVNRFLNRERFDGYDLFIENKKEFAINGGPLSVDDSMLDCMDQIHIGKQVLLTKKLFYH